MAISTIRKASDEDIQAVNVAWAKFCARHPELRTRSDAPGDMADVYGESVSYYEALWQRIICRALDLPAGVDISHPVCIAYGVVGTSGY